METSYQSYQFYQSSALFTSSEVELMETQGANVSPHDACALFTSSEVELMETLAQYPYY